MKLHDLHATTDDAHGQRQKPLRRLPWLPALIGVMALAATVFLWQRLVLQERQNIQRVMQSQLVHLQSEMVTQIALRVQAALEKIADPVTGEKPKPAYVIVGEIVIDQVAKDSAIGRITAGDDIRARDLVRFK